MVIKSNSATYRIQRVLEYSTFFSKEEPIDITATLKLFSRDSLVRMATIVSLHFGNYYTTDKARSFFSPENINYNTYIVPHFNKYIKEHNLAPDSLIPVFTFRTGLELWRNVFAIHVEEFQNTVKKEDSELLLFKILLSLNEKLFSIKANGKYQYELDEMLFLNYYLTNDLNNYDFQAILQPQIFFFKSLVDFIPNNPTLVKAVKILHGNWGITSWEEYFATIVFLAHETETYRKEQQIGLPILNLHNAINNDQTGLLSPSLIRHLCIDENEYIPYDYLVDNTIEMNIDYRIFRSKPLVKLKEKEEYVVINIQLLCERLFNSLYFDFLPLINGRKNSVGHLDYNKYFIEHRIFRSTMYSCIQSNIFTFPTYNDYTDVEERKEPDFYIRYPNSDIIIIECKAIKMNGSIRDEGDYYRLLDELREKIVLKTRELDKSRRPKKGYPEPIGLGQLIEHIDSIESDSFKWDDKIPDAVAYYPIIVFEDVRYFQPGFLSILNRWFYELIESKNEIKLSEISIMPVMAVSINTLFLYNEYLKKNGLNRIVNKYVKDYCHYDIKTGKYHIPVDANFDAYLRRMPYRKQNIMENWLRKAKNKTYK
jgi:hypothetical protein